ncbi:flagellin [Solibacillus sp. FSL K6-4121]|uniref:flagellin n=1 Tax=Solibacillus sp. FSL K6-4121 TaxID=2921505 RepID=UPI0030F4BBE2
MAAISKVVDSYDFRENKAGLQNKHIIFVTNEVGDDNTMKNSTLANLNTKGIQVHGIHYSGFSDLAELASNTGGKSIDLSNANWGNELSTVIGGSIGGSAGTIIEEEKMATLFLQVGAIGGQTMKIELFDARTHKLGVDDLQLDPYTEAQKAILKIDEAIQLASSHRSKFGSYQNALQHIEKNVSNYKINLTNAESQIRDVDISKEIVTLTNQQVLLQASTAMLAQANQLTSSILQFLK